MERYAIYESVRTGRERVRSYEDLEIHHPSKQGREPGRHYAVVDGDQEEVLAARTRAGNKLVSKDFILVDQTSRSSAVAVPAPVAGYVGRVDRRNGLVDIYDKPDGELLARIRHMDLRNSPVSVGSQIAYGAPLGLQGGFGSGNPRKFPTHTHIDFNESHLDRLRDFIKDVDAGVIRVVTMPERQARQEPADAHAQAKHAGETLQRTLNTLGYRDAIGHALIVDGDLGARTREAVRAFQRACGLPDDGVVGRHTRAALAAAAGAPLLSEAAHPDHALYRQARAGIERLEQGGFAGDTARDNAAAMLVFEAKVGGMQRIDHVVANVQGTGLFAVEGGLHDPAHRRVYVDRGQAADRTVAQASEQLRTDALAMQGLQPRLDPQLEAHQPAPDVRIHAPHTDRRPSF